MNHSSKRGCGVRRGVFQKLFRCLCEERRVSIVKDEVEVNEFLFGLLSDFKLTISFYPTPPLNSRPRALNGKQLAVMGMDLCLDLLNRKAILLFFF